MENGCRQARVHLGKPLEQLDKVLLTARAAGPEYLLEGLMLKLKLQYISHLIPRADSFEKTLMLGKIEGRRKRG